VSCRAGGSPGRRCRELLDKAETAERLGKKQVHQWRRSYGVRPPAVQRTDPRYPGHDPRYAGLDPGEVPRTECLRDTAERVMPYWQQAIAPAIQAGQRVLVAAHGNSLRALVKYLDGISDEEIPAVEIPTGIPLRYELDASLRPLAHAYLDEEEVEGVAEHGG